MAAEAHPVKLSVADIMLDDGRAASFIDKTDDDAIYLRNEKANVLIVEVDDFDDARDLIATLERSQTRKSKKKVSSASPPPPQDPPPGSGGGGARTEAPKEGETPSQGAGAAAPDAGDKPDTKAKKEAAPADVKHVACECTKFQVPVGGFVLDLQDRKHTEAICGTAPAPEPGVDLIGALKAGMEKKPEPKVSAEPPPAKKPKALRCGGTLCRVSDDGKTEIHPANDKTCQRLRVA